MKLISAAAMLLWIVLIYNACSTQPSKPVTNAADYNKYLYLKDGDTARGLKTIDGEIAFWSTRFEKMPDDLVAQSKVAGLYGRRFMLSGNIKEVHIADSIYRIANRLQSKSSSGTFRSLAANCITQHQFRQARLYIDSALILGDDKFLTVLMNFDVCLELGDIAGARKSLESLTDKNAFEYLIRQAKMFDHEGDLESAIKVMETAFSKIKDNGTPSLYCWAKSNLGDMYSHANRFSDAYAAYLDVLAIDPDYYHCLKGIAWLAFSKDNNIAAARNILTYLSKYHPIPDYDLMLAEIAAYENNPLANEQSIGKFINATNNPLYGDMYNKYLFHLYADELKNTEKAFQIAQIEVNNRPTPQSYDLLAWAYYKKGAIEQARAIAKLHVENQYFEPEGIYHLGIIYKAAGDRKKAKQYLYEAKKSGFEVGPSLVKEIEKEIETI
jgi:tetratricopeptide (TPR) repeat protein